LHESHIRELLVAYTSDEPPLTAGYHDVHRAGRRSHRSRMVAVAAGLVATAAVAMAAGIALVSGGSPGTAQTPVLDRAPVSAAASAPPAGPAVPP
jgi:hypothetical protein